MFSLVFGEYFALQFKQIVAGEGWESFKRGKKTKWKLSVKP